MSGGPYGRGKAPERSCMKLADWPGQDRAQWRDALLPADPFDDDGGSRSGHRPHSNRKVEVGYGRWLTFLENQCALDPTVHPADRITRERVTAYVRELDHLGNSTNTVVNRLQELGEMAKVLAPRGDWRFISRISAKVRGRPQEPSNKRSRMVGSDRLLSLGLKLMADADHEPTPRLAAMAHRDGLLIALLALLPLRRGNLARLAIGSTLIPDKNAWTILIPAEMSKNHGTLEYSWPEILLQQLKIYLDRHRPVLAAQIHRWTADTRNHLWVSAHGSPMTEVAIYDAIRRRTAEAFGTAINPHLFRDEAATALALHTPATVRSAAPLLGHRQLATTERYYQQAQTLEAQKAFAQMIEEVRSR